MTTLVWWGRKYKLSDNQTGYKNTSFRGKSDRECTWNFDYNPSLHRKTVYKHSYSKYGGSKLDQDVSV